MDLRHRAAAIRTTAVAPSTPDCDTENAPLDIRPGCADDAAAVAELLRVENHRTADIAELGWMLAAAPSVLAWQGDRLVGVFYSRRFAPDVVELRNTLVSRDCRGRGVGGELARRFEDAARSAGYRAMIGVNCRLHPGATRASAASARAFWLHMGWSIIFATDGSAVVAKHL